jgi:hypothetical protein
MQARSIATTLASAHASSLPKTVEDSVNDLTDTFARGWVLEPMTDPRSYNSATMLAAWL